MLLTLCERYIVIIMTVDVFTKRVCVIFIILMSLFVKYLNELHLMIRKFLHDRKMTTLIAISHVFEKCQKICNVVSKWKILAQDVLLSVISYYQLMLQFHVNTIIQKHLILFVNWDCILKTLNLLHHSFVNICDLLIVNSQLMHFSILLIDDLSEVSDLFLMIMLCKCLISNHVVHVLTVKKITSQSDCVLCYRTCCRTDWQHLRMISYSHSEVKAQHTCLLVMFKLEFSCCMLISASFFLIVWSITCSSQFSCEKEMNLNHWWTRLVISLNIYKNMLCMNVFSFCFILHVSLSHRQYLKNSSNIRACFTLYLNFIFTSLFIQLHHHLRIRSENWSKWLLFLKT